MDWIDEFFAYTDGLPTPEIFRTWGGISAVAGALERRVWAVTARKPVYPNLYVILVSPPGRGKTVMVDEVSNLWRTTKELKMAPDSVTKASLVDKLAEAGRRIVLNGGSDLMEYHGLQVACSEFGVLVPSYDPEFMSALNNIWDNPRNYRESRRTLKTELDISNPYLNMLAGTQPAFLAGLLPEEAWGMGFMSRLLMVYSPTCPEIDLFPEDSSERKPNRWLVERMEAMANALGIMKWRNTAQTALSEWAKAGGPPKPEHTKLEHYNIRRVLHIVKLSTIASMSRSVDMIIESGDVERAIGWLTNAEAVMPDIFREMVGRSDAQVIADLHFHMWRMFSRERKAVPKAAIVHFLQRQVPSDKIEKIISTAENANIIARYAGTETYFPKAKHEHGME